jgi:peptide/nickel transport system permease protein
LAIVVLRRLLQAIPLILGVATLVFFLSRLLPGDATSVFLSPTIPTAVADHIRAQFGLDRPVIDQYLLWLRSLFYGELGYSFGYSAPVFDVLCTVFPNTVILGIAALALELVIAVAIAGWASVRAGSWIDKVLSSGALVVYTLPTFWVGIVLLTVFSYSLGILPSSQMYSLGVDRVGGLHAAYDLLKHTALPALSIALPGAAGLARYLRTNIQATANQEFVVAAKSMGLPPWKIFRSYVLPNAIGPVISLAGIEVGVLLSGVLVTETLFAWPGIGRVAVQAIFARDYPLILGCTLVACVVVIVGNLLADLLNALIDPRIRHMG